jgi:flavin reductase (DIM6/NTAB) family NADH-FMN oxidoreductase RutF
MIKLATPFDNFGKTAEALAGPGALLMTGSRGNPMTIGWAQIGVIWGKPVMTVLVRPSRFSHDLLEGLGEFAVNTLPLKEKKNLAICGSRSGRDTDKIALCGFHLRPGVHITVPSCEESDIIYECRVLTRQDLPPQGILSQEVGGFYCQGDYHTLYHGEILGAYHRG